MQPANWRNRMASNLNRFECSVHIEKTWANEFSKQIYDTSNFDLATIFISDGPKIDVSTSYFKQSRSFTIQFFFFNKLPQLGLGYLVGYLKLTYLRNSLQHAKSL